MALDKLPGRATKTAKEMTGVNYRTNEPLIGEGESNPILPPGFDSFSLTDEERTQYDIKPHEDIAWIRNPEYWGKVEFKDRSREWKREAPGLDNGRRVVLVDGKPIENGDLILAAKPKAEAEAQRLLDDQAEEFMDNVQSGDVDGVPRWRPGSTDDMRAYAEQQHFENISSGLIGPTAGMDFEVVMAQKGLEAMKREQAFYRSGGRHTEPTTDAQETRLAEAADRSQAASKGRVSAGYSRQMEKNAPSFMRGK